jgi:hypothetical protein
MTSYAIKEKIMNFKIATIRGRLVSFSLAMLLIVLSAPVFAHGGFDHVIGNVVKVSNNVLTVKTSTGNVDVKLDAKTEIMKDKLKAQVTDLAPGVRVVVDIPEGSKDNLAHDIKIGAAAGHDHEAH